ncbi:hypothetical protein [Streptomyces sp. 4N124]|uniref:hypothetical protein n=1 Tax=Streptomyces sp. 4N124 TaxID=3457420 RepID=UPI003FCF8E73
MPVGWVVGGGVSGKRAEAFGGGGGAVGAVSWEDGPRTSVRWGWVPDAPRPSVASRAGVTAASRRELLPCDGTSDIGAPLEDVSGPVPRVTGRPALRTGISAAPRAAA